MAQQSWKVPLKLYKLVDIYFTVQHLIRLAVFLTS
mgnify:CR=1 FL=1